MTIHAHTDQGASCPAYINISERVSNPGDVVVTVRSAGENDASTIILSRDQLHALSNDIRQHLDVRAHWGGCDLDFGTALIALKDGKRVARAGWNGKGMWLAYTPGSEVPREHVKPGHALSKIAAEFPEAPTFAIGGHIDMRAADGTLVVGWLASQTDMLAEDWLIVA